MKGERNRLPVLFFPAVFFPTVFVLIGLLLTCGPGVNSFNPAKRLATKPASEAVQLTSGERVARLSPEQVSNTLASVLKVRYGVQASDTLFVDYLTSDFPIPLGGLDFYAGVRLRDPLTKAQTLLASRVIAWEMAIRFVYREMEVPQSPDSVFTKASFVDDHPSGDAESRARWEAQLQDLFLMIYSRPADAREVSLISTIFSRTYDRNKKTSQAWLVTIYSMLASMEMWNTWR